MSKIDLHIHSFMSDDGELSPREIIEQCQSLNMELIAITDHNSVRGISRALSIAEDIHIISGIELDCTYQGKNFHLLGYGFDHTRREFTEIEQDILKQEKNTAAKKIYLFSHATGIPISLKEVLDAAHGGIVTGELVAELLLKRKDASDYDLLLPYLPGGVKSDMPNVRFYWDYFSEGKPAYVPIQYLSLPDAVALIHETGGIAVLAHPGQNLGDDDSLLEHIIAEKIDGIEAFSSYHSNDAASHYLEIAQKNHLFVTCGSDFHGKHKPGIQLGGHNAFWDDQKLMTNMKTLLSL